MKCTYLLVYIFSSLDSNNLSSCFVQMGYFGVINELLFHNWLEFHMCVLVNTLREGFGRRSKSRLTIGLSKDVFTFDTWNISTISWNLFSWTLWLLEILSHIKFWWLVAGVTGNRIFVIWNEHIFTEYNYKLLLFLFMIYYLYHTLYAKIIIF